MRGFPASRCVASFVTRKLAEQSLLLLLSGTLTIVFSEIPVVACSNKRECLSSTEALISLSKDSSSVSGFHQRADCISSRLFSSFKSLPITIQSVNCIHLSFSEKKDLAADRPISLRSYHPLCSEQRPSDMLFSPDLVEESAQEVPAI